MTLDEVVVKVQDDLPEWIWLVRISTRMPLKTYFANIYMQDTKGLPTRPHNMVSTSPAEALYSAYLEVMKEHSDD